MKEFKDIAFNTQDTKDFDASLKYGEIIDFLEKEFSGDIKKMVECHQDYQEKLDEGDDSAERGRHKWAGIEATISSIAFGGEENEWLYFQNSPSISVDFRGVK